VSELFCVESYLELNNALAKVTNERSNKRSLFKMV
jgi:hypothetical protein